MYLIPLTHQHVSILWIGNDGCETQPVTASAMVLAAVVEEADAEKCSVAMQNILDMAYFNFNL